MLHVQDPAQGPAFEGRGRGPVGGTSSSPSSSSSLQNRKHDKDSNFNFLPPGGKSDENRNQNHQGRPRNLSPLGRDHQSSGPPPPPGPPSSPSHHLLSPLSRFPCWSPLEPLPEIESGDDSSGRVPPDGAEERGPPTPETGAPPRLGGGPAPKGPVMTARERFKAQEMERHQVQLTMYRRLALIRWVRTLQGHVAGQQDRLQASFDVVLTHRKELLRMAPPLL
uniref:CA216 protein n=1 Tax=Gadus morhua TaxID=8049 RepID=A0A8C5FNH6_GADMO